MTQLQSERHKRFVGATPLVPFLGVAFHSVNVSFVAFNVCPAQQAAEPFACSILFIVPCIAHLPSAG